MRLSFESFEEHWPVVCTVSMLRLGLSGAVKVRGKRVVTRTRMAACLLMSSSISTLLPLLATALATRPNFPPKMLSCLLPTPCRAPCSARYAPDLSAEEVKAGMEMLDANNDKLISLSEFVDWWVKKAA